MAGFSRVAAEVIAANEDVKELIKESAERAVATGAAAEELAVTINHVAATMKDTADSADASSREAAAMTERMRALGEALARVNSFSDMIRGIAAQTNLLALNATIEAARAGEAGRGFAVVAAEVKALSKQTGDATTEIAAQVAAVEALMAEARGITAKIAASLTTITDKAGDVAAAVAQQRDAAQAVSSHMSDIVSRAQDTSDAADRALREGSGLARSAEALETTVRDALRRSRERRRPHAAFFGAARAPSTKAAIAWRSSGFGMKASKPEARQARRSSSEAFAVTARASWTAAPALAHAGAAPRPRSGRPGAASSHRAARRRRARRRSAPRAPPRRRGHGRPRSRASPGGGLRAAR